MVRSTLLFAVAIAFSVNCFAEDSPAEKIILKVYPVGDLVSAGAMKINMAGSKMTSKEWTSEYPETLQALEELQSLVETMCTQKPVAVKTYAPSLSLIVRHSQDGHNEIDQLLRTLGEGNNVTIHMECRLLDKERIEELMNSKGTEADQTEWAMLLLLKSQLSKVETTKILTNCSPIDAFNQTVKLKSGHRTTWGVPMGACTAMGRVNRSKNSVDIRIDFVVDDYYSEGIPIGSRIGSQTFSLTEGESALFRHDSVGGRAVWLITTKIIPQEKPASLVSQKY